MVTLLGMPQGAELSDGAQPAERSTDSQNSTQPQPDHRS